MQIILWLSIFLQKVKYYLVQRSGTNVDTTPSLEHPYWFSGWSSFKILRTTCQFDPEKWVLKIIHWSCPKKKKKRLYIGVNNFCHISLGQRSWKYSDKCVFLCDAACVSWLLRISFSFFFWKILRIS